MNKKYKAIYIALGANLSNPRETFLRALQSLEARQVTIDAVSGLWQSPAWPPGSDQPDYINAAAKVSYEGSAAQLLAILHEIENEFGRMRSVKNAARTLDLDLLDYKGQIIKSQGLEVPHPRMLSRGFVLFPLAEIAPQWRDPAMKAHILDHIAKLPLSDVMPMNRLGKLSLNGC